MSDHEAESAIPAVFLNHDSPSDSRDTNTNESISSSSVTSRQTSERRLPMCAKCQNHGKLVPVKDHKKECPHRGCTCVLCRRTSQKQKYEAANTSRKRQQRTDGRHEEETEREFQTNVDTRTQENLTNVSSSGSLSNGRNSSNAEGYMSLDVGGPVPFAQYLFDTLVVLEQTVSYFNHDLEAVHGAGIVPPATAMWLEQVIREGKQNIRDVFHELEVAETELKRLCRSKDHPETDNFSRQVGNSPFPDASPAIIVPRSSVITSASRSSTGLTSASATIYHQHYPPSSGLGRRNH